MSKLFNVSPTANQSFKLGGGDMAKMPISEIDMSKLSEISLSDLPQINSYQLAKQGFLALRILIGTKNYEAAYELADALHNLPTPNDRIPIVLTWSALHKFAQKYPHVEGHPIGERLLAAARQGGWLHNVDNEDMGQSNNDK